MKKVIKVISLVLVVVLVLGSIGFLVFRNIQLDKSYKSAISQQTKLQAQLDAIGTFTDVLTVKADVNSGQEITKEDIIPQTIPTSAVPANAITDPNKILGKYFRIGFKTGLTITSDLIDNVVYDGAVYDKDVFMDSLPLGTKVGDYIDFRVVLPGGEEFVVLSHRRVNARFENTIKMNFDEADLWLYTSVMTDRALYKTKGFKIYATKYVDPGRDNKVTSYYPVRKEVMDIVAITSNLSAEQKGKMWNENLRKSIDAKLAFYNDDNNKNSSLIASANSEEQSRYKEAEEFYKEALADIEETKSSSPSSEDLSPSDDDVDLGNLGGDSTSTSSEAPANTDGQTDAAGNGSVIKSQDYLDNLSSNLFDDETAIE